VRLFVTEHDTLGGVIAVGTVTPSPSTLARGRAVSFSVAFVTLSPALTRFAGRASR
jgi:hypothetical protein